MTLKLNGSSSGSVSIDAPASTTGGADVALTLPVNDGDANEVLQTNGSGALTWAGNTPAFAVRVGTEQTWTNATTEVIDFDTEILDSDGCFDTSTHRFTPTSAGYYYLYLTLYIAGTASNKIKNVTGQIRLNDTTNIARGRMDPDDSYELNRANVSCSCIVYLNGSSDFIEGSAYGNITGGSPKIDDDVGQCMGGFKLLGV